MRSSSRHPVEPAEEIEILERRQLRYTSGSWAAKPIRPRSTATSSVPPVGATKPARTRRSVVFPDPFGPVTTKPRPREIDVDPTEDAALAEPLLESARIIRGGVQRDEAEKHDADHTVHREERRVQPAKIARPHEAVLVREQSGDSGDSAQYAPPT